MRTVDSLGNSATQSDLGAHSKISVRLTNHQVQFPLILPAEKEFDGAGFGVNAVDHLLVVPEFPHSDTKAR
ncbi:MAG: hypothetical protein ABI923_11105, partial [bacterium]